MRIKRRRQLFQQNNSLNNPFRMLLWAFLIMLGLIILRGVGTGDVQPLFLPTPTSTRSVTSYREEGAAFFEAGNLDQAILAYQDALNVDQGDYLGWAELARIQTYSSSSLTQERKRVRLEEARQSIEQALIIAPDESDRNDRRSRAQSVLDEAHSKLLEPIAVCDCLAHSVDAFREYQKQLPIVE